MFTIKDERSYAKLYDSEVVGCLFDPFIKLDMIREGTFDPVQLGD